MSIQYLDPEQGPESESAQMGPRSPDLEGVSLGLLNNGKPKSGALLERVAQHLQEEYEGLTYELFDKPSPFKPAPDEVLQQATEYGAIITGIGD